MSANTDIHRPVAHEAPSVDALVGASEARDAIRDGRVVVIKHNDQSLLVSAASMATKEQLQEFEARSTATPAVALEASIFDRLGLQLQAGEGTGFPHGVPVDAVTGAFAAMSRAGRAHTIRALAHGETDRSALSAPGHVTPLRSSPGNLLTRIGLVEAAIDLLLLAGLPGAALVSFLVDDEGQFIEPGPTDVTVALDDLRTSRLVAAGGLPQDAVANLFRQSMTSLAGTVSVVTCPVEESSIGPTGLVVSSMVSYSADPPSVVFSVTTSTRSHTALKEVQHFGVNILAHGQDDVARTFASRKEDKFECVEWDNDYGTPRIKGVQSFLHCRKVAEFTLGDHTLFVGAIIGGFSKDRQPMVYFDRKFNWQLTESTEGN